MRSLFYVSDLLEQIYITTTREKYFFVSTKIVKQHEIEEFKEMQEQATLKSIISENNLEFILRTVFNRIDCVFCNLGSSKGH